MSRAASPADFPQACPVCGGRLLGRIGTGQFFCWDCCAQFSRSGPRLRAWTIDAEGVLVPHQRIASSVEGDDFDQPGRMQSQGWQMMRR